MTDTPGRKALIEFLQADAGRSQRWLARLLEVGQSCVSLWVRGQCCPDNVHIEALRVVAGIPADAWLTDEDREKLARVAMKEHVMRHEGSLAVDRMSLPAVVAPPPA